MQRGNVKSLNFYAPRNLHKNNLHIHGKLCFGMALQSTQPPTQTSKSKVKVHPRTGHKGPEGE